MEIDRSNGPLPNASLAGAAIPSGKATELAGCAKEVTTQLPIPKQLPPLRSAAASRATPFDVNKVAEIHAAIAEGRFEDNADRVADGWLTTARDLIRADKRKP